MAAAAMAATRTGRDHAAARFGAGQRGFEIEHGLQHGGIREDLRHRFGGRETLHQSREHPIDLTRRRRRSRHRPADGSRSARCQSGPRRVAPAVCRGAPRAPARAPDPRCWPVRRRSKCACGGASAGRARRPMTLMCGACSATLRARDPAGLDGLEDAAAVVIGLQPAEAAEVGSARREVDVRVAACAHRPATARSCSRPERVHAVAIHHAKSPSGFARPRTPSPRQYAQLGIGGQREVEERADGLRCAGNAGSSSRPPRTASRAGRAARSRSDSPSAHSGSVSERSKRETSRSLRGRIRNAIAGSGRAESADRSGKYIWVTRRVTSAGPNSEK